MIFAWKNSKIPQFYIFDPKMPTFYIKIALSFFPEFWGARAPISYAYDGCSLGFETLTQSYWVNSFAQFLLQMSQTLRIFS